MTIPTKFDIAEAEQRIGQFVYRTPVMTSASLDEMVGASLFFKCENFQKIGAFKYRGASNAVQSLSLDDIEKGVCTHSSGNHAQALALAAVYRGTRAYIAMPRTSSKVKVAAAEKYGAIITFCEPTLEAREETLNDIVKETGATFIHPYNDSRIIAGQATAAKELIENFPNLDIILAPVGGGGLLSGTALSASYFSDGIKVIGVEPENADDAYRSLQAGKIIPSVEPDTIADGLLTSLGDLTFAIIQENVEEIVTVSEKAIIEAMRLTFERMKIVIEPSAAVPLAALIENKIDVKGKNIGIIITGGNVDMDNLPF